MNIALVQMGYSPAGREATLTRACELIDAAVHGGAELVVLPEFFNTPYFPQHPEVRKYWDLAEPDDGPSLTTVRERAAHHGISIIAPIYEEASRGFHYDTAFVVGVSGEIVGRYRKTHAPAIEGGYEKLYYTPGSEFPVFGIGEWQVGVIICYDWRFPEAARSVAVQGADLIVVPFATPRMNMWHQALSTRAWENQVYLAVCNKVGIDGDWIFFGTSLIVDPFGNVVAQAGDSDEAVISAEISLAEVSRARVEDFNWRDRRPEIYGGLAWRSDPVQAGVRS